MGKESATTNDVVTLKAMRKILNTAKFILDSVSYAQMAESRSAICTVNRADGNGTDKTE